MNSKLDTPITKLRLIIMRSTILPNWVNTSGILRTIILVTLSDVITLENRCICLFASRAVTWYNCKTFSGVMSVLHMSDFLLYGAVNATKFRYYTILKKRPDCMQRNSTLSWGSRVLKSAPLWKVHLYVKAFSRVVSYKFY